MLLKRTTVPVGLLRCGIITRTDQPTFILDDDSPGYSRITRERSPIKTHTSTKNVPAGGRRRRRIERRGGGEPTYLCRTGTRDSAVPRKTMSPARCALARRPRSSARRWDCCCCSCVDCCSAGPASSASSRAGWHASGPASSMARTFAYAASSTSFLSSSRASTRFSHLHARARARGKRSVADAHLTRLPPCLGGRRSFSQGAGERAPLDKSRAQLPTTYGPLFTDA